MPGSESRRPTGRGGIGLSQTRDGSFELVHPRCVLERRADYLDAIEQREAGDPEGAQETLRYVLEGCGDNLWAHVALGWIALEDYRNPGLARGHFGYAFELVERALPRQFQGKLPRALPSNQPFYEAAEGLSACYEALSDTRSAREVLQTAERLGGKASSRGS